MNPAVQEVLRSIPAMDQLLAAPWVEAVARDLGHEAVKAVFSDVVGEIREDLRQGRRASVDRAFLDAEAHRRCLLRCRSSLHRVVNATGVVIHTNLGRSCLHAEAVEAVREAAESYSTLEYRVDRGERGHRNDHVEWLLCQVTGADAAFVVNNNAGAVLLGLAALARNKQVVVSRGELVEIGGSFRVPDILAFSGAHMVEVGTTNRTHLADYEGALSPETALLLKVHPSNYRVVGFSSGVDRSDLARLAREKDLILMEDLGSGMLVDLEEQGLPGEPTVRQCLRQGVDLVTFSGDKLLGGPQIGALVGRRQIIDRLRTYPLARALRVDKMTLAAFEATLRLYLQGRWREIPSLAMLGRSEASLEEEARRLIPLLEAAFPEGEFAVVSAEDAVGGGAYPAVAVPGIAVAVRHPRWSAGYLQQLLRQGRPSVVAGARDNLLMIHLRALLPGDGARLAEAFRFLGTAHPAVPETLMGGGAP
ncbi:MAG TPA: L-seryl-tRNA(Sec) selenium transferase [Synergistaceae bacterium]|nr:L-seryl-tRNA(Sec) selenium transferase [Synergistaceae bacterium]